MDGRNPAPLWNNEKPLFVGTHREIIILGFLRWCRILSIHSMSTLASTHRGPGATHEMIPPRGEPFESAQLSA